MDYSEMLFAAAVRELAQKLKSDAWKSHLRAVDPEVELDSAAIQAVADEWAEKNPTSNFIPKALDILRNVASQIRELQG